MKDFRTLLLTAAASLAAALPAQDPTPTPTPAAPARPEAKAAPAKAVDELIEELGSDSYRARLDAERKLRELGEQAVPALQRAAESADDAEVQWRARRVLHQIERGGAGGLEAKQRGKDAPEVEGAPQEPGRALRRRGAGPDPMRDEFESLFERLNRDFGIDIPRARFFDDGFFRDLQEQMKAGTSRSQGMSMQIGPDGKVRVEVREKGEDGKDDTKVYEAPDLETFQKQHPGVLHRNGLGMGLFPGGGLEPRWFTGQPLRGFTFDGNGLVPRTGEVLPHGEIELTPPAEAAPPPAGKRLGITIRTSIPAEVRQYLELEDGVGLQVESVGEGSLAAALGLQKGDIVTHIGKQPIGSPQDVQDALGPIAQGADVEVRFVRKGRAETATAKKAEATAEPVETGHAEAPADGKKGRLQRRGTGNKGSEIR